MGEPEELPVLGSVADACCVGTTWQASSIVCREDVLPCFLSFRQRMTHENSHWQEGGASSHCAEAIQR